MGQVIELDYADELGSLEGMSTGGHITLRRGLSPGEEFSTLAHELAHEMLHRDKDCGKSGRVRYCEPCLWYASVHPTHFVICQGVGLDTNTAASHYIQLYAGDKDTLAASLGRVQHTSTSIISVILDDGETVGVQ